MKLLRAEFKNFRLLRDLELEFSTDPDKKLTVIRAANESGKTTILHGLQWALYGDGALPDKGEGFRLHPIDWVASDGKRVPIMAVVEFELTTHRRVGEEWRETRRHYRLVRSAFEDIDSQARRSASTVDLLQLNDTGASPMSTPEAFINENLPPQLREVFFTDGDRALSFIEADVILSTKRDRVEQAICSLLGLEVINDAIKHVGKSAAEVNKQAKQLGSGSELNKTASRLETLENDCKKSEDALADAKQQFRTFDEYVNKRDREIDAALQKGDKEKLRKDLEYAKNMIRQLDRRVKVANEEHSALFRSRSVATDLLAPMLGQAFDKLEELREQGKIPYITIPVLEGCLSAEICICGETLEPDGPGGDKRRARIQKLINDSRHPEEIQEVVAELLYYAKPLQTSGDAGSSGWLEDYKKVAERRDDLGTLRNEEGRKLRALELQLDSLPNTDIQGLRKARRQFNDRRDHYLSEQSAIKTQLTELHRDRIKLETERDRLLRKQKSGARVRAELEVTQDVRKVLQSAYERITNKELRKVSDLMNNIFLEMIGADPKQGAIIQRAEISREFDIIAYGPNDRTLNPDRDLNGASRRALTLAFILALTKVSEVEAPNVIDTPLGMTSGFVKRSVLHTSVRESAQLILFLTHDEITGCEEIIDQSAGVVFTLTNSAHYPKMLVNDPGIEERRVLRCECDHKDECQLCRRRPDPRVEPGVAS